MRYFNINRVEKGKYYKNDTLKREDTTKNNTHEEKRYHEKDITKKNVQERKEDAQMKNGIYWIT